MRDAQEDVYKPPDVKAHPAKRGWEPEGNHNKGYDFPSPSLPNLDH
jgi:hypothetical protein